MKHEISNFINDFKFDSYILSHLYLTVKISFLTRIYTIFRIYRTVGHLKSGMPADADKPAPV